MKGFSPLAAPLTDLTKEGSFRWTEEAQKTFDYMKGMMSTCPVLALPDFTQPFVLECDASCEGIGAVFDATFLMPLRVTTFTDTLS